MPRYYARIVEISYFRAVRRQHDNAHLMIFNVTARMATLLLITLSRHFDSFNTINIGIASSAFSAFIALMPVLLSK